MKEQNEKQDTDRSASIIEIAQKIVTKNFLKHAENVLKLNKQLIVEKQIYDDLSSCGWDIFVDQRCKRFAAEHLARCGYSKQSVVVTKFYREIAEKIADELVKNYQVLKETEIEPGKFYTYDFERASIAKGKIHALKGVLDIMDELIIKYGGDSQ